MDNWILLAVLVLVAAAGYRRLLALRGRARGAWSGLEAQLEDCHERIQELLQGIEKPDGSESAATESLGMAVQRARDARGIPARARAENELSEALCLLLAGMEKSGRTDQPRSRALSEEWIVTEERTVRSAESYNQHVMAWNQALHRFPWSMMARLCRFRPIEYFVLDDLDERRKRCWSTA